MENEQGKRTNFIGKITGKINDSINERRFRNNPNVDNFFKLSEEKRKELLEELDDNIKYRLIKDLPENEKVNYIYELDNEYDRADIIATLSKEKRDTFMSELSEEAMLNVLYKLPEEQRYDYVEMFKEEKNKIEAIKSLPKIARAYHVNKLSEESKYDYITSIPNEERGECVRFLENEDQKVDIIKTLPEEERFSYINYLKTREGKIEVIKTIPEKNEILEQMSKTNSNVEEKINPNLLDDKYIEILGIERVNQISCYDEIQNRIEGLSDTKLEVIGACIDHYETNGNSDEWNVITNSILRNMHEYGDLFADIERRRRIRWYRYGYFIKNITR